MATAKHYMGVDPGASGAAIVVDGRDCVDALVFKDQTPADVLDWFLSWGARESIHLALLEKAQAFPGMRKKIRCKHCGKWMSILQAQGVSSAFKYGRHYGLLETALLAAKIPHRLITPGQWQRIMGVPAKGKGETKSAHKNKLKAMAQRRYPADRITLAKADAYLLADLAKRMKDSAPF